MGFLCAAPSGGSIFTARTYVYKSTHRQLMHFKSAQYKSERFKNYMQAAKLLTIPLPDYSKSSSSCIDATKLTCNHTPA